jgi:hypothetical protein
MMHFFTYIHLETIPPAIYRKEGHQERRQHSFIKTMLLLAQIIC